MIRALTAVALLVATPSLSALPAPVPAPVTGFRSSTVHVTYAKPVPGVVVRRFEPPPTPYAAGHRGVDLATVPREVVRASAAGRVSFAGTVAGRGVVVIAHAEEISTEYEPVAASVNVGTQVLRGAVIGTVSGTHGACAAGGCLHWGARRGSTYLDPTGLLARGTVRLLPYSG